MKTDNVRIPRYLIEGDSESEREIERLTIEVESLKERIKDMEYYHIEEVKQLRSLIGNYSGDAKFYQHQNDDPNLN